MKKKIVYQCSKCGYISQGFFGKCPNCGSWNTLEEKEEESGERTPSKGKKIKKMHKNFRQWKFLLTREL